MHSETNNAKKRSECSEADLTEMKRWMGKCRKNPRASKVARHSDATRDDVHARGKTTS